MSDRCCVCDAAYEYRVYWRVESDDSPRYGSRCPQCRHGHCYICLFRSGRERCFICRAAMEVRMPLELLSSLLNEREELKLAATRYDVLQEHHATMCQAFALLYGSVWLLNPTVFGVVIAALADADEVVFRFLMRVGRHIASARVDLR